MHGIVSSNRDTTMTRIELSKETIKAIHGYAENYTPDDDTGFYRLEGVEFHQDGYDILVDMEIYGHWDSWTERHDEVPPPNEEHFSE